MIYIWYLWQRFTNLLFIVINVIQILLVWLFCTKMSNTEKTKRCSNFTKEEERILTQLVHKNRNIIECKKSGQVTWEQKANTWRTIADEFNSTVGGQFKGVQILKCKYANLKKVANVYLYKNSFLSHFSKWFIRSLKTLCFRTGTSSSSL